MTASAERFQQASRASLGRSALTGRFAGVAGRGVPGAATASSGLFMPASLPLSVLITGTLIFSPA